MTFTTPSHSLDLTVICLIPSLPLLIAYPPTWCTNARVWGIMLFVLEKRFRCYQNVCTSPHVWLWTLTYWYLSTPNPTSFLFRIMIHLHYANSMLSSPTISTTNLKWRTNLYFNPDSLPVLIFFSVFRFTPHWCFVGYS